VGNTKEFSERVKNYVARHHVLTAEKMTELDCLVRELFNKENSRI